MAFATIEDVKLDLDENLVEDEYEFDESEPDLSKYSPQQEAFIRNFAEDFIPNTRSLAIQTMEYFFRDKMHHCGGKIPKNLLFNERRISMVMNFNIIAGVSKAYEALEKTLSEQEILQSRQTGETTSDIRLVNDTLNFLARSGVPQQFAGGIMCLYLEFVEGVDGLST